MRKQETIPGEFFSPLTLDKILIPSSFSFLSQIQSDPEVSTFPFDSLWLSRTYWIRLPISSDTLSNLWSWKFNNFSFSLYNFRSCSIWCPSACFFPFHVSMCLSVCLFSTVKSPLALLKDGLARNASGYQWKGKWTIVSDACEQVVSVRQRLTEE